jgi:hypothetical protein
MKKKKEEEKAYDYSAFEKPGLGVLIKTLKRIGCEIVTEPKFERGMWRFKVKNPAWD